MAASQPRVLDATAPPFIPPALAELYTGPPTAALPPPGFFYPPPLLVAPPAPGIPATSLAFWGFPFGPSVGAQGSYPPASWAPLAPPQGSCSGMQGPSMHHGWTPPLMATQGLFMGTHDSSLHHGGWAPFPPMAPAGMQCAPSPQLPACPGMKANAQGGRRRASRSARAWPGPRAKPPPRLVVPPRMQPAVGRVAPPSSGVGKGEHANEPSPRSVLVQTSPPLTPSALPTSFPYPELGPPSPPASGGAPSSATAPAAPSQSDVVPPRRKRVPRRCRQATGGGAVRCGVPKPRRIFDESSGCTTLMIRNIPNDFRRTRLMKIIDQHFSIENENFNTDGVKFEYDFLYLPMDFRTGANKGFAFVNLTTPEAARRLWEHLHNHRWKVNGSGKTCEVDQADIQGRDALVKNFSDSRFDCGDEEFLPVWFEPPRDGVRTTLPHLVGRMLRC